MVEGKSTPGTVFLDIETLNSISARLYDRAEQITQVALADMAMELRIAARCADLLAHIRFELSEIAGKTTDPDTAREIRDLLDDASKAEPSVGEP
jgi:hypothetical protein